MKWLDNMILQTKLILLAGFMMVALGVLGFMSYTNLTQWEASVNEIGVVRLPSIVGLSEMSMGMTSIAIQQNRVRGLKGTRNEKEALSNALEELVEGFKRFDRGYQIYAPLPQTPEEEAEWKRFEGYFADWKEQSLQFRANVLVPLISTTDEKKIEYYYEKMFQFIAQSRKARGAALNSIDKIMQINVDIGNAVVKESKEEVASDTQFSLVVVFGSFAIALTLAFLIIRSITNAITSSVATIRDGAMQITSASDQVASSSSSLAQGASEQASSVEEVSATLEESTAINTQNTDNARQADILAKNANDSARAGYEKGEQLSNSMHAITESAAKISGIIKAIDQIAFQTNLLALNAAVEAARAGEHGLGFAVVADEVRNLAQRAAGAAKETSDIIEEVVEQIKEGNQIALATHTAFQEIVEQSKKVSDLIGEIAIAGKEQAEGMTQINQAMGQVDQVTQQVAANSEEAAAAAEELNAQATSMMETVRILASMVGMATTQPQPTQHKKIAKQPLRVEVKKSTPQPRKPSPVAPKNDEVFPLSEDDLKEF